MKYLSVVVALAAASIAGAQEPVPKRPKVTTDSNDASGYIILGTEQLVNDPAAAVRSFWWAARLDPSSPAAWYGRSAAMILADDELVRAAFDGTKDARVRARLRAADSLEARARLLDPFLFRAHDRLLLIYYVARKYHINDIGQALGALESALGDSPPRWQAWYYYSTEKWPEALGRYAESVADDSRPAWIYQRRGEIFQLARNADSALAQLTRASVEFAKQESKEVVAFYAPKALLQEQIGVLHERARRRDKARDAYGQAIVEDLSYAPAHVRLAAMALQARDTATAVSEFLLATQAAPGDAYRRYQCAYGLSLARRSPEAIVQLRAAISLEPWYPEPRLLLARLSEAAHDTTEARTQYQAFLARATMFDTERAGATQRLAALTTRTP